jgi:hypothetical protein
MVEPSVLVMPPRGPSGEWSGQAEWMRFARLIQTPGRGGAAARAAYGGNLSLSWLPPRVVRFARLIDRRVRVLAGPSVRAAIGGNLSLPWWLLRVVPYRPG